VSDPIVACVRTGTAYSFDYLARLRNMVARHLRRPYIFACFTDQPEMCDDVVFYNVTELGLPGWWSKMMVFEPIYRGHSQIIFFDLDTVICGDLSPLLGVPDEFAILESPVRRHGNLNYPCKFNSSCMVIGAGRAAFIWKRFEKDRDYLMAKHHRYGDQAAIEELYPDAAILNERVPPNFFLNYRDLTMHQPPGAAVVNFGGSHRPHNCPIPWVQKAWV
jgi:hypothetical protein